MSQFCAIYLPSTVSVYVNLPSMQEIRDPNVIHPEDDYAALFHAYQSTAACIFITPYLILQLAQDFSSLFNSDLCMIFYLFIPYLNPAAVKEYQDPNGIAYSSSSVRIYR